MFIKGEKGKVGVGFSLKDPNQTGKCYYVYVWNKNTYNKEEVKERRQKKGNNDYSKVGGWRSLGKYPEQETMRLLLEHLILTYGMNFTEEEVQEELEKQYVEMEKRRIEKLKVYNMKLIEAYHKRGIKDFHLEDTIKKAKLKLIQLNA